MKARRVIPLRLRPNKEQERKIESLFEENRRLLRFLVECCKRRGITDYQELQRAYYGFCRGAYHLPSEVIIQQMKQVCATFKGAYRARHIPKIDIEELPITLTHGKKHLFYFLFTDGLSAKISLPSNEGFEKEQIEIHRGALSDSLNILEKASVSDSLLFPDYRLLVTITKEVKRNYEPETFIGIDFGIRNLVTAVSSTSDMVQYSGEPIIEAFKKGVEHRRRKQMLGSKKFTYNDKKVVKDYVYHVANEVIAFAKQFDKPVIVLEHLKGLGKRMSYLPHVYSIAPYNILHEALINKALWDEILFKVVSASGTSITCPICGFRDKKNRDRTMFHCLNCGYENDADVVAGINIGRRANSHEPRISLSLKSEASKLISGSEENACNL